MGFNMQEELASPWLSISDVPHDTVATIAKVTMEEVGREFERKFAVTFQARDMKPMLLNKTNMRILVTLYGTDTDGWLGKQVVVYNDPNVIFGGQLVGGLRLKAVQQSRRPAPAPPVEPSPDYDEVPF